MSALSAGAREHRVGIFDAEVRGDAAELEAVVAHKGAGQQVRLAQNLEAVADADDGLASLGVSPHSFHHGRESGDGAGAQVVAVGEAAGDDDGVVGIKVAFTVPDEVRPLPQLMREHVLAVLLGPGAGEYEHGEVHGGESIGITPPAS